MRALARFALVVAAFTAVSGLIAPSAGAKPKPKDDDSAPVTEDIKKGLIVLSDGQGIVIAVDKAWTDDHWVFFGDGKTMYQQRVFGGSSDGSAGTWDYNFWSPRVNMGGLGYHDKKYVLECGEQKIELKKVPDVDAKKMMDAAAWKKPFWHYQAAFLARDDGGTYYYVDRLRDEWGGKGHRIFAGQKGAMKELPMTNIVSDSKGEIYSTKGGELRFVTATDAASWIKGSTKTELTIVPPEDNVKMIYGELGVYEGTLGTPCDDQ
jgi:hypothetical protein